MSAPLQFTASDYFSRANASVSGLKLPDSDAQPSVSPRGGETLGVDAVKPGTGKTDCEKVRDQCLASFKHEYESAANEYDKAKLADGRKNKCLSVLGSVSKWIGVGIATVATGGLFAIWYKKRQADSVHRDFALDKKIGKELIVDAGSLVKGDESLAQKKEAIEQGISSLANQTDAKELDKGFQNLAEKVKNFRLSAETEALELKSGFSGRGMYNLSRVKNACRSFVDCKKNVPGTETTYLQKAVNAITAQFKDSPRLVQKINDYVASSKGILSEKIINAIVKRNDIKSLLEDLSFGNNKEGKRDINALIDYGLREVLNEAVVKPEENKENERSRFAEKEFVKNYINTPSLKNDQDRNALVAPYKFLYELKTETDFDVKLQPDQKDQLRDVFKSHFLQTAVRSKEEVTVDAARGIKIKIDGEESPKDDDLKGISDNHKPILRGFATQQIFTCVQNNEFSKIMGLPGWNISLNTAGGFMGEVNIQKSQVDNVYKISYDMTPPVEKLSASTMTSNFSYSYKANDSNNDMNAPKAVMKFDLTVKLGEKGKIEDVTVGKDIQLSISHLGAGHGNVTEVSMI